MMIDTLNLRKICPYTSFKAFDSPLPINYTIIKLITKLLTSWCMIGKESCYISVTDRNDLSNFSQSTNRGFIRVFAIIWPISGFQNELLLIYRHMKTGSSRPLLWLFGDFILLTFHTYLRLSYDWTFLNDHGIMYTGSRNISRIIILEKVLFRCMNFYSFVEVAKFHT